MTNHEILLRISYLFGLDYSEDQSNYLDQQFPKAIGILKLLTLNNFDINIKHLNTNEELENISSYYKENVLNIIFIHPHSISKAIRHTENGGNYIWATKETLNENFLKDDRTHNSFILRDTGISHIFTKPNKIIIERTSLISFLAFLEKISEFILLLMKNKIVHYTLPEDKKDFVFKFENLIPENFEEINKKRHIENKLGNLDLAGNTENSNRLVSNKLHAIKTYEEKILELKKEIADLENVILYSNSSNKEIKEKLINFLTKNALVEEIYTRQYSDSSLLQIITKEIPLTKFDPFLLQKLIDSNEYNTKVNQALQKVVDNKATLYFGKHLINITFKNDDIKPSISITFVSDYYGNPHLKQHNCWGNYLTPVEENLKINKFDVALLMTLEMLQSLNFGDSGSGSFLASSYIVEEGETIYDARKDYTYRY